MQSQNHTWHWYVCIKILLEWQLGYSIEKRNPIFLISLRLQSVDATSKLWKTHEFKGCEKITCLMHSHKKRLDFITSFQRMIQMLAQINIDSTCLEFMNYNQVNDQEQNDFYDVGRGFRFELMMMMGFTQIRQHFEYGITKMNGKHSNVRDYGMHIIIFWWKQPIISPAYRWSYLLSSIWWIHWLHSILFQLICAKILIKCFIVSNNQITLYSSSINYTIQKKNFEFQKLPLKCLP